MKNIMENNLCAVNIKDFTVENTLYIKVGNSKYNSLVLSKFVYFDSKNHIVHTELIQNSPHESLMNKGSKAKTALKNCALYGIDPHKPDNGYFHWFNSRGYALDPEEEYKIIENNVHVEKHPSFGLIRASRRNGDTTLFGSSIQQQNSISIEIQTARHRRDLNRDWYSAENSIIQIEMSPNQFAEFITSLNVGEGIPCTIKHRDGKYIGECPFISKVEIHQQEFENKMYNLGVDIKKELGAAMEILKDKPTINKADREYLMNVVSKFMTQIQNNIPFATTSFMESMDKTVTEAKAEIEAFFNFRINQVGMDALKNGWQPPKIENE